MKRIGTICTPGGSKGVKNKNIRDLAGQTLITKKLDFERVALLLARREAVERV